MLEGGQWQFFVPSIVPYVRTTQKSTWTPRYRRYAAWKHAVRLIADTRGVPTEIDPSRKARVSSVVGWAKKARADLDNAGIKNILDALWRQDRRVQEIYARAVEFCGVDQIQVVVEYI